jgi:hypothetical protein
LGLVLRWVLEGSPTRFGFVRSRWSCECVAILLEEDYGIRVSRETVRRRLRGADLVWRRPRPVLGPKDPAYAVKLGKIRALLRDLPANAVAVFMDEVDVNTNPKIGAAWMRRGEQVAVVTPGNNEKRYLAGSLDWRTGRLTLTEGQPRAPAPPAGAGHSWLLAAGHLARLAGPGAGDDADRPPDGGGVQGHRQALAHLPGSPALIRSFDKSPRWALQKRPGKFDSKEGKKSTINDGRGSSKQRPCAVFEYCGEAMEQRDAMRPIGG